MSQYPTPGAGRVPADTWAGGHAQPRPSPIPAMIVGAVLFACGCGGGLVVGWLGGLAASFGSAFDDAIAGIDAEPDILIDADYPESLAVGQPFELKLTITDTRGEPRTVQEVDLNGPICDAFEITDVTPPPAGMSSAYGYREHSYEAPLSANGSFTVTVLLTPRFAGTHESTATVYMEGYTSQELQIVLDVR